MTELHKVCGASMPGSKHQHDEKNNQDFFAYRIINQACCLVVCDGAGSAHHSRKGAEIATEMCLEFLEQQSEHFKEITQETFHQATVEFINALQENFIAKTKELNIGSSRELSTTLLAVLMHEHGYAALQIGDGFIVLKAESDYCVAFLPQKGEYANETYFVTSQNAVNVLATKVSNVPLNFVCLSTDGLEDGAIKRLQNEPHAPFFNFLYTFFEKEHPEQFLKKFLLSPKIDDISDDDKTLLIAKRNNINIELDMKDSSNDNDDIKKSESKCIDSIDNGNSQNNSDNI